MLHVRGMAIVALLVGFFARWGFRYMMLRELLESMDVPALILITGLLG